MTNFQSAATTWLSVLPRVSRRLLLGGAIGVGVLLSACSQQRVAGVSTIRYVSCEENPNLPQCPSLEEPEAALTEPSQEEAKNALVEVGLKSSAVPEPEKEGMASFEDKPLTEEASASVSEKMEADQLKENLAVANAKTSRPEALTESQELIPASPELPREAWVQPKTSGPVLSPENQVQPPLSQESLLPITSDPKAPPLPSVAEKAASETPKQPQGAPSESSDLTDQKLPEKRLQPIDPVVRTSEPQQLVEALESPEASITEVVAPEVSESRVAESTTLEVSGIEAQQTNQKPKDVSPVTTELEFVAIELPEAPDAPEESLEPTPPSAQATPLAKRGPEPDLPEYTGAFVPFEAPAPGRMWERSEGDLEPVAHSPDFPPARPAPPRPRLSQPPLVLEPQAASAVPPARARSSAFEGGFEPFSEPASSPRQPLVLEPVLSELTAVLPTGVAEPTENPFLRVYRFVEKWRRLWEQEGGEAYLSLYATDFQGGGRDLTAWRLHKLKVNALNRNRRIALTPTRILFEGNRVRLDLLQAYQSSRLQDWGLKELELREQQARYQIVKENWKALSRPEYEQLRQEQSLEEWAVPEALDLQALPSF